MQILFHTVILPFLREWWYCPQMLGFGYLSAYLKKWAPRYETAIAATEESLFESSAPVIGLSTSTYSYFKAVDLARRLKKKRNVTIVLGGPHVSALPGEMDPVFDYGVQGEGEEAFTALVRHLSGEAGVPGPAEIPGLIHWEDGARRVNPRGPYIANLDSIPFPDRDIFDLGDQRDGGTISVMTSRGCPYDCRFCAAASHWGCIRYHSPEYVVEEWKAIWEKYHPALIRVEDDIFVADKKRLARIVEMVREAGLHEKTRFHVSARVNHLTPEVCALLKSIRTVSVFVGFESNSAAVLESLGKRGVTPEMNQTALDNLRQVGIPADASFVLGAPGETRDDVYKTYQFIVDNRDAIRLVSGGILRILPGTDFWRQAMEKGLIDAKLTGIAMEDADADGWDSMENRYPMLNDAMSRGELMAFQLLLTELGRYFYEKDLHHFTRLQLEELRALHGPQAGGIGARLKRLAGRVKCWVAPRA